MMHSNPNPQEDLGYAYVQLITAKNGAIWRQTTNKDIGIDGIIEMKRKDGASLYIAVQVKSGESYFKRSTKSSVTLYKIKQIPYWNTLQVPVILVIYNPYTEECYWVNIKQYCLDTPECLRSLKIVISKDQSFDSSAFEHFHEDARAIFTPKLSKNTIKEFLNINRHITLTGFVELTRTVLNKKTFICRRSIDEIEYLYKHGLLELHESPYNRPPNWSATKKGEYYVRFMLGDRYFTPFILIEPTQEITERDIEMCLDFDKFLEKLRGSNQ